MPDASRDPDRWTFVDHYLIDQLITRDPARAASDAAAEAGLPRHEVSPPQGKLLNLIARAAGAKAILELGTLGGYSTIWLAQALPADGRLVTLESDPRYAETARASIEQAGLGRRVELRVGRALETLPALEGPFDFIFIDADKRSNPEYLEWALRLSRKGTLIVADNVIREGAVADSRASTHPSGIDVAGTGLSVTHGASADARPADPSVEGVRRFIDMVAAEPRLEATAIQTVGTKGWDGFLLALVVD